MEWLKIHFIWFFFKIFAKKFGSKEKSATFALPFEKGVSERAWVLKKAEQRRVMNCGLSFEKKSKKIKKKFASSEKSLTFATPIQKGVWNLKTIRGLIQGRRQKTKVFWIILRWMQGGRSEERGSSLVVMTDWRTSPTQQALKRSKKRSLKRLRFSTRSKYRETKKSRSVNSFGIKSCQGELRII